MAEGLSRPTRKLTYPLKTWRVALAFTAIPLAAAAPFGLILSVAALIEHGLLAGFLGFLAPAVYGGWITLPGVLIGIPALWLYRRNGWDSRWSFALGGAVVATILVLAFTLLDDVGTVHEALQFLFGIGWICGALAGLVFHLVLYAGLHRTQSVHVNPFP